MGLPLRQRLIQLISSILRYSVRRIRMVSRVLKILHTFFLC